MPVIVHLGGVDVKGNRYPPLNLYDIGKKPQTGQRNIYQPGQVRYLYPGRYIVLQDTDEVKLSRTKGQLKGFLDKGIIDIKIEPVLQVNDLSLIFNASLADLAATASKEIKVTNIGDPPSIVWTLANNTGLTAAGGILSGREAGPFYIRADGPAILKSTKTGPFNIPALAAPTLISDNAGPYNITYGVNDVLRISVDGAAEKAVQLTAGGAVATATIVNDINAIFPGLSSNSGGKVLLTGPTAGSSGSIKIGTIVGFSTANPVLGFDDGEMAVGTDNQGNLRLNIDGGGFTNVPITTGAAVATTVVVGDINAVFPGVASEGPSGEVVLTSTTTGLSSTIYVDTVANGSTANTALGFSPAVWAKGFIGNDTLRMEVDGGGMIPVTLTAGLPRTADQVAADINVIFPGVASVVSNKIVLTSTTTGVGSSVKIDTEANGSTANGMLGFLKIGEVDFGNAAVTDFITVSTLSGTSPQLSPQKVTVSIDQVEIVAGMTPGVYTGTLVVNAPGIIGSPQTVSVILNLTA